MAGAMTMVRRRRDNLWPELETLKDETLRPATEHDDATANSTKQDPKKIMQRLRLVRIWWTNPNFFVAFSWTVGMKNRLDLNYEKL